MPSSFVSNTKLRSLNAQLPSCRCNMGVKILLDIAGGYLGSILSHTSVTRVPPLIKGQWRTYYEGKSRCLFEQVISS